MTKSIMIQGTASNVGKTIITLALCRIFKQDGYNAAPFKAQNMTANTIRVDGNEIAISQYLQCLAAGIEPTPSTNPVILKPSPNGTGIVLNGKSYGVINAHNYVSVKEELRTAVAESYAKLKEKHEIIVIEGAGSPVELNLAKNDIVNMGMAKMAGAPVLVVADIDRGGVFASLYGTVSLFSETDRSRVKATIVNRFRGETRYFEDGVKILEDITNLPVAGVIPYMEINLPEEDTVISHLNEGASYDSELDKIACHVRYSINMELIYKIMADKDSE